MRSQQSILLPMFSLLAQVDFLPEYCRLDLLVCAIAAMMDATFDQKCAFFLNVFDKTATGFYNANFLLQVVMLFGEMFYRLRMLPSKPIYDDVECAIQRWFMDLDLDYKVDELTIPEARR